MVPALRVRAANDRPVERRGKYVLYWMIGARRTTWSFALDRAIEHAKALGRPLAIFEPLRAGYPWASDRMHAFVMDGMAANAAACAAAGVAYVPYVEPEAGAGRGLLAALAKHACCVVTDEQPGFFLGKMVAAAARAVGVRMEVVDSCGVLPLAATGAFLTAALFRRHFQKVAAAHVGAMPAAAPLRAKGVRGAALALPRGFRSATAVAKIAIDHGVAPVAYRGGSEAGGAVVDALFDGKLARYVEDRNDPDAGGGSGLSPYLHFGHVGAHEVVARVWAREGWDPSRAAGAKVTGSREGWWGMSPAAEAFLDELVTWREVGYGFCHARPDDFDRYESLPGWALATLRDHAKDPRPVVYTRAQLEGACTHDALWNAAQRQLVIEGRIHNYLRMLWGKKVLEWSRTPREALATLIELNNKYAVDGRDPNSYSGIFWCFGRFDRAWGPVRPIFGTVRYMSSVNTAKKLDVAQYLARWGAESPASSTRR